MTPTSTETLTKERYLPRDLPELMGLVKIEKRTGQLVLHFNQGGMCVCEWQSTVAGQPGSAADSTTGKKE